MTKHAMRLMSSSSILMMIRSTAMCAGYAEMAYVANVDSPSNTVILTAKLPAAASSSLQQRGQTQARPFSCSSCDL